MAPSLVLASKSTRLHICVENLDGILTVLGGDCAAISVATVSTIIIQHLNRALFVSHTLSPVRDDERVWKMKRRRTIFRTLMFRLAIRASMMTLTDEHRELHFAIPFSGNQTTERIRLDTFFSLIFGVDDAITIDPPEALSREDTLTRIDLQIRLQTNVKIAFDRKKPSLLHTATLLVEKTYIPVSRELLAYGSVFFANLFNEKSSKNQEVFEIKDVNLPAFRWFIGSFMSKEFNFMSVKNALVALRFADRFGFHLVHKRIFPSLKQKMEYSLLIDALTLCGKFGDNEHIIMDERVREMKRRIPGWRAHLHTDFTFQNWLFKQCTTQSAAFKLLSDCAPNISARTMQTALVALEKVVDHLKKKEIAKAQCSVLVDNLCDDDLALHMILHEQDSENEIVKEYISRVYGALTFKAFRLDEEVWPNLPKEYNLVKIDVGGQHEEFRREDDSPQECEIIYRVMEVHAYITTDEFTPEDDSFESEPMDSDPPLVPVTSNQILPNTIQGLSYIDQLTLLSNAIRKYKDQSNGV